MGALFFVCFSHISLGTYSLDCADVALNNKQTNNAYDGGPGGRRRTCEVWNNEQVIWENSNNTRSF